MMLSRGFGAFCIVASVVQVQAWMGQHDLSNGRKAFVTEPAESKPLADVGRQIATFGAGCFLAAATAFSQPAFADAGKFSYSPNLGGPETWSSLKVEGNQCSGSKQSPIAIKPTACNVGANYEMKHGTCTASDLDFALGRNGPKASFPKACSGTTLRIPFVEGQFEAVQFHMHIGSEHTIGGQSYESEFHIVHKQIDGDRFAVVGIMLNGDAKTDNIQFQRLLDGWDQVAQKVAEDCGDEVLKKRARVVTEPFNVYDLIPAAANFYHYDGSLTTPPCSEVVWWNVADVPLSISRDQMDQLKKYTTKYVDPKTCELDPSASNFDGTTNRPTAQDNAGRKVIRICPINFFGA